MPECTRRTLRPTRSGPARGSRRSCSGSGRAASRRRGSLAERVRPSCAPRTSAREGELAAAAALWRALGDVVRRRAIPRSLSTRRRSRRAQPRACRSQAPVAARARRARRCPCGREVELAFRFCTGRVIGITGSNGKSTTTAMIGTILLRAAGRPGWHGRQPRHAARRPARRGRARRPCTRRAVVVPARDDPRRSARRVAVMVNLTPRPSGPLPQSLEAYAAAKARLLETQRPEDAAVLNADDPGAARFEPHRARARLPLSRRARP